MRVVVNALTGIWTALDTRRRAFLIGGVAAFLMVLLILSRVLTAPSYALLYSGLDAAAAGDVIAAIEARGVAYRVQGDAIEVEAGERDALRMSLAGEGLPANGAAGYELLDSLSGFGTTSQMFDAAYWRAKEGELARTITSSPRIRAARVHIASPSSDPFQATSDVTASIALRPAAGGLGPGHAQALRYLVASSVPGLLPENVTVLDADSGQVVGGQDSLTPGANAASRAEEYRRNIERLLAARVGPGNAVVQVSVELDTARETILERRIDPESRVIVATETEERDNTARDTATGGVTVASNLPEGDGAADGGESSSQTSESRERVTYDMSEVQREIERGPGDIRRLSVAVLLNGVTDVGADGIATRVPRPAEEIAALRSLVESAVGFDAERGDTVTVESMVFDESVGTDLVESGFADRISLDLGRVIQTVVLTLAALFIAFGVLRPLLRRDPDPAADNATTAQAAAAELAGPTATPEAMALAAPEAAGGTGATPDPARDDGTPGRTPARADRAADDGEAEDLGFFPAGGIPELPVFDPDHDLSDPVSRLRRMIEEREEETMEILRSWMEEDEEVKQ
jgi:flagellar M-ring protein FliF